MRFLHDNELAAEVRTICQQPNAKCAVAFLGDECRNLFPEITDIDSKMILNLGLGGTNPAAVRVMLKDLGPDNVRKLNTLHAKVYIGESSAIVCSANASLNGLGSGNDVPPSWREAGVRIDAKDIVTEIEEWFAKIWNDATEISEADLLAAEMLRKQRPPTAEQIGASSQEFLLAHGEKKARQNQAVRMALSKADSLNSDKEFIKWIRTTYQPKVDYRAAEKYLVESPYGELFTTKPVIYLANTFLQTKERIRAKGGGGIKRNQSAGVLLALGFRIFSKRGGRLVDPQK